MSPFLWRCQTMKGFFSLRPCDAQAPFQCASCQNHVCEAHVATTTPLVTCRECAARQQEDVALEDGSQQWFYRTRSGYYQSSGYSPHTHMGIYNDYDAQSFERRASDDPSADGRDPDPASLLDS